MQFNQQEIAFIMEKVFKNKEKDCWENLISPRQQRLKIQFILNRNEATNRGGRVTQLEDIFLWYKQSLQNGEICLKLGLENIITKESIGKKLSESILQIKKDTEITFNMVLRCKKKKMPWEQREFNSFVYSSLRRIYQRHNIDWNLENQQAFSCCYLRNRWHSCCEDQHVQTYGGLGEFRNVLGRG